MRLSGKVLLFLFCVIATFGALSAYTTVAVFVSAFFLSIALLGVALSVDLLGYWKSGHAPMYLVNMPLSRAKSPALFTFVMGIYGVLYFGLVATTLFAVFF